MTPPLDLRYIRLLINQGMGSVAHKALSISNIKPYPAQVMIIIEIRLTNVNLKT